MLFWFLNAVAGLALLVYAGLHGYLVYSLPRGQEAFRITLALLETHQVLYL